MTETRAREASGDRVLPQDDEAEVACLGAMLLDADAAAQMVTMLRPEVFHRGPHGVLFRVMAELFVKGTPLDVVLVRETLQKRGLLDIVPGLHRVIATVPTAANAAWYAEIVLDRSRRRAMILASAQAVDAFYDLDTSPEDAAGGLLAGLQGQATRRGMTAISDSVTETMALCDGDGAAPPIPTGWVSIDVEYGGLPPQGFIVVAARPSMGKTSFALQLVRQVVEERGTQGLVFSIEMSRKSVTVVQLAQTSGIPGERLRRGSREGGIRDEDGPALAKAANRLHGLPIWIADSTLATSPSQIRAHCLLRRATAPVGIVVVDYLQLMDAGAAKTRNSNKEEEISYLSRTMKLLSDELACPVVVLSQLNRESVRGREHRPPVLSDLRGSGSIEQDADVVMFIHRPEMLTSDKDEKQTLVGKADIIFAKYREGRTGSLEMRFDGPTQTFKDYAPAPDYTRMPNRAGGPELDLEGL